MKDNMKVPKVTLVISAFSLFIASINLVFSRAGRIAMWPAVTIFFSNAAILCCSIVNYRSKKNKDNNIYK